MLPSSAPTIDALHRPQHEAEAYGQGGEWAAQPRQDKEGQVPAPVVVPSTAHPLHTPPQAPTGMVGLRLAALPMDQCAARMLNLARLSSVTTLPTHTAAEPLPSTNTNNNNTTNGLQRDGHASSSYTTRPFLFSSLAAYPNHMERIARLCAPVACAALHGVGGLAWAPALVLLCLWRGNALPPSLLTLVGTALALTTREGSADALLCFAWTTLGGALVVGQIGGWIAQVAGATTSVLWLASLVVVSPAWGGNNDWSRATLLAIRAIAYELLCLCTTPKATPAECWARYGALLTCASAAPLLAGSLTLLGVALLWTQRALWVNGNKATASDADLHLPPDALDVQEAFRRARAQYYLSGSAQPPSSIEKNA